MTTPRKRPAPDFVVISPREGTEAPPSADARAMKMWLESGAVPEDYLAEATDGAMVLSPGDGVLLVAANRRGR